MILRRDRVIKYENRIATLEADSAAKDARIEFLEKALEQAADIGELGVNTDLGIFDNADIDAYSFTHIDDAPEIAAWLREQEKK